MEGNTNRDLIDASATGIFLTMSSTSITSSVVPTPYKVSTLGKRIRDFFVSQDLGPQRKKTKLSSPVTISQTSRSTEKPTNCDTRYTKSEPQTLLSIAHQVSPPSSTDGNSSYFSQRVACLLNTLCKRNGAYIKDNVATSSVFFKAVEGPGEVQQLVDTIEERDMDSVVILTTALILLDRMQRAGTLVYRETVVRLFTTCALVAMKIHKEEPARNRDLTWLFVNPYEVPKRAFKSKRLLRTIRRLEAELLEKLQWRTFIAPVTYCQYQEAITEFFL